LSQLNPPEDLSVYLLALWYDAKGEWTKAHEIIQDEEDKAGSWIHAYLHRKEGDIGNADYWYRKAGKTRPDDSLEEEWKHISSQMIQG
jgi:hypothetical protein